MVQRFLNVALLLVVLQGCSSGAPDSETPTNEAPAFVQAAQSRSPEMPRDEAPATLPRSDIAPVTPLPSPVADMPSDNASGNAEGGDMRFPEEVTDFMVTRDGCDHFRGEEPYDAERRAYLEENVRQLCAGTDARLADLRRRYRSDRDVIAALGNYEEKIEPASQE